MRTLLKLKYDELGRNYALVTSNQAGGFNGGDKSTDFSEESNRGNATVDKSNRTYFSVKSIGATIEKLHPAPIVQDLCSAVDLALLLAIVPSGQLGMLDMWSTFAKVMTDVVAHEVAQITASAGLVVSAKINITEIVRKYFNMEILYHSTLVSTRQTLVSIDLKQYRGTLENLLLVDKIYTVLINFTGKST